MLITPQALMDALDQPGLVIIDCRYVLQNKHFGRELYRSSHLPGALYADLEQDLSGAIVPGLTGRHPLPHPEVFAQTLRQWGLTAKSDLVLYDEASGAMAARLWWLLGWAGIDRVRLLDGGFKAWQALSGPVTEEVPTPVASNYAPVFDHSRWVSSVQVEQLLGTPQAPLLDARALPRFRGEVEPLDPVAGHIPSAVCMPFEENLNPDNSFRSPGQLAQRFAPYRSLKPVCYCGSGVTACHNIFAMSLAGLAMPRLYPGSWSEWITDPQRPVSQG